VSVPPPLVFLGFILVGVGLRYAVFPLSAPVGLVPRLVVGGLLFSAGFVFMAWARGIFVRSGQDPAPWQPSPSLVREGPYRFSRNPMYVGMTTVQMGIGFALNNLWIVAFAIPALIIVHFTAVRPEEAYLGEKFGESYAQYKATVRRYL
jgi:protein-S-isoprenylcysteine O-methyltransferase Ste14